MQGMTLSLEVSGRLTLSIFMSTLTLPGERELAWTAC